MGDDFEVREVVVPRELAGERLDKVLHALLPEYSRAHLRDLVDLGHVRVGNRVETRARYLCNEAQRISVVLAPRRVEQGPPAPEFRVLHVDESILVISKPAGLPAHRNEGVKRGTVADYAQRDFGLLPALQGRDRPGIIHRLDKETSGVMVLARTTEAFLGVREQFQARTVRKEYRAIVLGEPRFDTEWIEKPIGRDPRRPTRMSILTDGRDASTLVEVLERFEGFTHVACKPTTGRTHQIRVHLLTSGLPVVGDRVYRTRRWNDVLPAGAPPAARQFLHAYSLEFRHPSTGAWLRFEDPLPEDMAAFLRFLRARRGNANHA